jgi:hypothetical protein
MTPPLIDASRDQKPSSWMGDHWDLLSKRPLYRMCFPGSHDSGTYMSTHQTSFSSERVTKTQILDIQGQLMQGVRYYDLRPVVYGDENAFYTAHSSDLTKIGLGYQGAIGAELRAALDQVRAFVSQNRKELVILRFSHCTSWGRSDFSDLERERLFALIKQSLDGVLICGDETDLCGVTMGTLIARGNVIAVFDLGATQLSSREGIWAAQALESRGGYSDTNEVPSMIRCEKKDHLGQLNQLAASKRSSHEKPFLFELCWQLTLQGKQNGPTGTVSILDLAAEANAALFDNVKGWLGNEINPDVYPNVINTDACEEAGTRAVELSISINKMLPD